MKLEVGKYYERRDGKVVGPVTEQTSPRFQKAYCFQIGHHLYTASGSFWEHDTNHRDLIREVNPDGSNIEVRTESVQLVDNRDELVRNQAAEIERLKTNLMQQDDAALKAISSLRAENAKLKAQLAADVQFTEALMKRNELLESLKVVECLNMTLRARVEELKGHCDNYGFAVGDLERERDTLKSKVEELEAVKKAQADKIRRIRRGIPDHQLAMDLGLYKLSCNERFATLTKVTEERDELSTQLQAANAKLKDAEYERQDARKRNLSLQQKLSDRQSKLAAADYSVEVLNNANKDLSARLAEVEANRDHFSIELGNAPVRIDQLNQTSSISGIEPERFTEVPTVVTQTWASLTVNAYRVEHGCEVKFKSELNEQYGKHLGWIRRDHYSDGTVKAALEEV